MNNNSNPVVYANINGVVHNTISFYLVKRFLFAGIKKLTDSLFSLIGLIVFSPLFLVLAILIKLDSKGPVFFKQERTGKFGNPFILYKFRTMVEDNDVHNFKVADKYTKIGKILRKTSLDELPQLINIHKGDMSFIGPRPWITDYYKFMNNQQRHRNDVKPGITGLAQCNGRNTLNIIDKINYDLEYIENYSLKQDIKIIFLTIKQVLFGKGTDAGKNTIKNELYTLETQEINKKDLELINKEYKKYTKKSHNKKN